MKKKMLKGGYCMKFKKIISFMLVMALSVSVFSFGFTSNAYVAHTQSEAISWLNSKVGSRVENGQCVGLTIAYYKYLGVSPYYGNACDYATATPPTGWEKKQGATPQKGDIMIWTGGYQGYGHVAICGGDNIFYHQNWNGQYVEILSDSYIPSFTILSTGEKAYYWGVIRPFNNCTHSYSSSSTYVCTKCGEWQTNSVTTTSINQTFQITSNDAIDHTGPYGDCKTVNKYTKGTVVTATQKVVNGYGSVWYKLSNGNYIWGDYLKEYSINYTTISTGEYYIKNLATGKYLYVSGSADVNEQNVIVAEMSSASGLKMNITSASTGYKIRPGCSSSRLINPYATTVVHGKNVNLYNDENDSSQWWKFEKVNSGYVIRNVQNPSCVLTASTTSLNVSVTTYAEASSQIWTLECVSHNYDSGKVTTAASCEKTGVKTYTCTVCGTTTTETLSQTDHKWVYADVVIPADCETAGTCYYLCEYCQQEKFEDIPATGHSYVSTVISPSCTSAGYTQFTCKTCGDNYTSELTTSPGHDFVESKKEATCTEEGYIKITCTVCGEYHLTISPQKDHTWDNGKTTKAPTNTETGIITYTCAVCGELKDETSPKLDGCMGDVNLDGKITASDARLALRSSASLEKLSNEQLAVADMDGNNKISAADARKILRIAAGLEKQ